MADKDENTRSSELATGDSSKKTDAKETAAMPKDPFQALRNAAGDLESIARSLEALQKRAGFRIVD